MGVSLDAQDRWSTPPRIHRLWAGVLLPPVAWAAHLTAAYPMSAALCSPSWLWVFYAASLVALSVSVGGGLVAWRVRREAEGEPETAPSSRARGRFMALGGVLLSGMFSLAILAQAIPLFVLEPCRY
jgi:hypothetical protein